MPKQLLSHIVCGAFPCVHVHQKNRQKNQPVVCLGLAISKQIAERHDGTISCESEAGKGTTIRVSLPVS